MCMAFMKIMKWVICFVYNIYDCLSEKWEFVCCAFRYLYGVKGQSGFGSSSTADQVIESFSSSFSTSFRLTVIITGATSGIGEETARVLAKRGVRVVMPARDMKKAGEVKERILKESPEALLILMELDLSSFSSIQSFCSKFLQLSLPLNILINNAGKFCRRLEHTTDSFEMTFGTNYLGHYLLTKFLLEKLIETASETEIEGRIINVTSVIHRWTAIEGFVFDDLLNPESYNGTRAYAQSKLANLMHAKELTAQLRERRANVTVNSVHPGIVKTGIIRDHRGLITDLVFFVAAKFLKSVEQGASTTCYVALSPQTNGESGKYFEDCNESSCSGLADDKHEARELWEKTEMLVQKFPFIKNS